VTIEDINGMLKHSHGNHQLLDVYWSQLKFRSQLGGKSLQEHIAAVPHFDHRVLAGLNRNFTQWEATSTFIDGFKDSGGKQ
jgi:hypothetical protein